MEKENIILRKKEDYICWKDYISLLVEEKESYEGFEENSECTKAQKAKALTIIKKYLDFSLHHFFHETLEVLEKYCIRKEEVKLLQLENELDRPQGRFFLEKINQFNIKFRNVMILGGKMATNKTIFKPFNLAPAMTSVELLKHDVEVGESNGKALTYNEVFAKLQKIAEISQELYLKKMRTTSTFLCYKCNQAGHKKLECKNDLYCSYCKKSGHSLYSCKNKTRNEYQSDNSGFTGAFIEMVKNIDFMINSI
eukprot:snap_masked-scaffold_4-processed-gene-5.26-mRNA-1 protein AED:1.00 eAED:1.00 QI:0/0/0/0/1/1/2/0/252